MTNMLGDVLQGRNYREPPEIMQIKEFVHTRLGLTPNVSITPEAYIVRLPSAAAAGTLRAHVFELQKELGNERRVVIRIG